MEIKFDNEKQFEISLAYPGDSAGQCADYRIGRQLWGQRADSLQGGFHR